MDGNGIQYVVELSTFFFNHLHDSYDLGYKAQIYKVVSSSSCDTSDVYDSFHRHKNATPTSSVFLGKRTAPGSTFGSW